MALDQEIGTIAWYSLMTTDAAKATEYYSKLFQWDVQEMEIEGMGKAPFYSAAGKAFGSPMNLDPQVGSPSHWIPYFTVADVDASCQTVESLGGKVCHPAFDMPSIGRTAIITDPFGGAFHLFTPENKEQDINVMGGEPGQPCWLELMVDDLNVAKSFYGSLLSWTIAEQDMGMPDPYVLGKSGEAMVAGIAKRPEGAPPINLWLPYFMVPNLKESISQAANLGGESMMEPMAVPGVGEFSLYADPSGAVSYLFQGEST